MLRLYYATPFYTHIDKGLIVAYLLSGALISGSDFAIFTLLFSGFSLGLLVATIGAYFAGLIVSYLLNRYWVFQKGASQQSALTNLWRYGTFLFFNLILTYAMLWILEHWVGISPYIGKVVVNIFMFFWIYIGNTYWVFKGPKIGPIQL